MPVSQTLLSVVARTRGLGLVASIPLTSCTQAHVCENSRAVQLNGPVLLSVHYTSLRKAGKRK